MIMPKNRLLGWLEQHRIALRSLKSTVQILFAAISDGDDPLASPIYSLVGPSRAAHTSTDWSDNNVMDPVQELSCAACVSTCANTSNTSIAMRAHTHKQHCIYNTQNVERWIKINECQRWKYTDTLRKTNPSHWQCGAQPNPSG